MTARQTRAIEAVLTTRSQAEAAAVSGVPLRTLSRWLSGDAEFRAAVDRASRERLADTVGRLRAASSRALDTLLALLDDATPAIRLRAAGLLLDTACKLEVDELGRRVAALEVAQGRVRYGARRTSEAA